MSVLPATTDVRDTADRHQPQIAVWDLGVRLFHWLLVAAVIAALATGYFAPKRWLDAHVIIGVAVAALIVFRLVWGFAGSTHARFANFVTGPGAVLHHVKELLAGRAGRHVGHNPLGAAMIIALLSALVIMTASGLIVLGGELKQGPLAPFTSFATGSVAMRIHAALAAGLMGLVVLHVTGVVIESIRTRDNLAKAMLTGRKPATAGAHLDGAIEPGRPRLAAAILAVIAIAAVSLVGHAARLPANGVSGAPLDALYAKECGACHTAYHPSLAPDATWRAVFGGLDDHFGDNASLDGAAAANLRAYVIANSAEHWDTRAAHWFLAPSAGAPLRITATAAWKRIHRDFPDTAFAAKPVGGKVNCANCHGDASRGLFAPQSIAIPTEKTKP